MRIVSLAESATDNPAPVSFGPQVGPEPRAPLIRSAADANILILAQKGRLAREAMLFAASLRRNSPGFRGRLIVAEPQPEGAWEGEDTLIPEPERAFLEACGAEILPFTATHFGKPYPYGNKIEALALLPEGEPFIFFDSDTLILSPLDALQIDFSRPAASMRREGTWPKPTLYGPDYWDIWGALYARFGLDMESSLDPAYGPSDWRRYLYFNAGWFFGADPVAFGACYLEWAAAVRLLPGDALLGQTLDPWLDQVILPLVIHAFGGGRPGPELNGLDGAVSCHYRNFSLLYARQPEAAVEAFESLANDPEIAALMVEDEGFAQVHLAGRGRSEIRPLFAHGLYRTEQPYRSALRWRGLWFRG